MATAPTLSIELLLVLPILLALLMSMIEFSLLLIARQELLTASREGARVAAQGGTTAEVQTTVSRVLGSGSLAGAQVSVQTTPEDPDNPQNGRNRVNVTVSVAVTQAVPDLLRWVGITFQNQELVAATVMNQE